MSTLTCPKCGSEMRTYERNSVHVDQCTGCGGLFLDRGELEVLVRAENAWHQQGGWQPPAQSSEAAYPGDRPTSYGGGSHGQYGQHGKGRRRKSFLEELFD